MPVTFRLRGQQELKAAAKALRRAARTDLRDELRDGLKAANDPTVRALKSAFVNARIRGHRVPGAKTRFDKRIASKGLRAPMARAIEGQVRTTGGDPRAQIVLREDRVPLRIRPLIRYFAGKRRLRHPVMGDRNTWAGQDIEEVWWPTIRKHLRDYVTEAEKAVKRTAARLEREI